MTTTTRLAVDVAVVGAGFAGAITALALRRRGRRVALVERSRHPRFVIGESSTPLANLLLEEIADRYDLPSLRAFSKWGTWRRSHPDVAVGLKRGFTFYFHEPGELFQDTADRTRQLMVAASPRDEIADTHWYRPDFDRTLVEWAEHAGVDYVDETALTHFSEDADGVHADGTRLGVPIGIDAGFLIDATGPRGFLHRTLRLAEQPSPWLPPTSGLYSHFEGVSRWDAQHPSDEPPPYPPDDAALHHIFPGGWIWVLRFSHGITSAGAALRDPVARAIRASDGEAAWQRLLRHLPSIGRQFEGARAVHPFVYSPQLAFRSATVCGPRWALLPSAAGVVDPLLSTGFPLTLLGVLRLLEVLETTAPGTDRDRRLASYARATQDEQDATERLVGALYATMDDPALFTRLTLLYFAAASYSEAVRRLGTPERAPGFLLHGHPQFGPDLRACCDAALTKPAGLERERLFERIARTIEPFDTAGLGDHTRRNWYPVKAEDILEGAPKLGATRADVQSLLERCGLVER